MWDDNILDMKKMFGDSLSTVRDEMNESFEMASYIFPYFWLKCKEIYNIDIVTSDKGKVELTAERRKGNHNQILPAANPGR